MRPYPSRPDPFEFQDWIEKTLGQVREVEGSLRGTGNEEECDLKELPALQNQKHDSTTHASPDNNSPTNHDAAKPLQCGLTPISLSVLFE